MKPRIYNFNLGYISTNDIMLFNLSYMYKLCGCACNEPVCTVAKDLDEG